ncbi:MAG: hypothetical protein IJW55_02900 [Clostridia bacterium]|nr:hypothetical protein [Clostridia bacterium]
MVLQICIRQSVVDDGWQLFVDDVEMTLTYMDFTEPRAYSKVKLDPGTHTVKIEKNSSYRSVKSAMAHSFMGWLEAVSGGGSEVEAVWNGTKNIRALYTVTVADENADLTYSFQNATLERCSVECKTVSEEVFENKQDKRRWWLTWKLPIMLLSAAVFLPLWIFSITMLIREFDFAVLLLFLLLTVIIGVFVWAFFIYKRGERKSK